MVSVLKYEAEGGQLLQMPYYVPANVIAGNGFNFVTDLDHFEMKRHFQSFCASNSSIIV